MVFGFASTSLLCWAPRCKFSEEERFLVGRVWKETLPLMVWDSCIKFSALLDFLNLSILLSIDLWFRTFNCWDFGFCRPGVSSKYAVRNCLLCKFWSLAEAFRLPSDPSTKLNSEIVLKTTCDYFSKYSRRALVVLTVSVAITLLEVGWGKTALDISTCSCARCLR